MTTTTYAETEILRLHRLAVSLHKTIASLEEDNMDLRARLNGLQATLEYRYERTELGTLASAHLGEILEEHYPI